MGFPRQDYWSGLPSLSQGYLPDPGIEPRSSALQVDFLPTESPGKSISCNTDSLNIHSQSFTILIGFPLYTEWNPDLLIKPPDLMTFDPCRPVHLSLNPPSALSPGIDISSTWLFIYYSLLVCCWSLLLTYKLCEAGDYAQSQAGSE